MAKIKTKTLVISPPESDELIISYRLRLVPTNTVVNYEVPYIEVPSDKLVINTKDFQSTIIDGIYDFFVTSVDSYGNESNFVGLPGVEIKVTPPSPPQGLALSE